MQTLNSAGNRSRRTSVASRHIKTSHSPCRRSISRAIAPRRTSVASQLIKASRSPCRRSISKAPAHDIRQGQHSTSKPAIPHVDARFYIHSVEAHTTKVITHNITLKQKPAIRNVSARFHRQPVETYVVTHQLAIPYVDARFQKHPLGTHVRGSTAHQNQSFPMWTLDSTSNGTHKSS